MYQSRQRFIAASLAVATIGIVKRPANAADFTYRLGLDVPVDHPMTIRATEAAQKIKQDSGGRLEVQLYPNNQLGGDTAMISQVRSGALHMTLMSHGILSSVVPLAAIENVAFAFPNYKEAFATMNGPLGASVRGAIAKIGLYAFDKTWCWGFKQIVNGVRPLNGPTDLKGLKIRVPPSPMEVDIFKAMNATALPVNLSETYVALQSHLVDGSSLPLVTVETSKFYEVQKYLTITNHLFTGGSLIVNGDAWQSLPKELRDIAERSFNAAALAECADIANLDVTIQAKLSSQGLQVGQPDLTSFRAAMNSAGLYRKWKDQFGTDAWALLERTTGALS